MHAKTIRVKKGEHVFLYIQLYTAIYFFQIPFEHHKNTG